jgi:hypothetical protein
MRSEIKTELSTDSKGFSVSEALTQSDGGSSPSGISKFMLTMTLFVGLTIIIIGLLNAFRRASI